MNLDRPIMVMVLLGCLYISYSIWFKGEREYTPPFWIEDKVMSYKCKATRSGVHSVTLRDYKDTILVAINGTTCKDIASLVREPKIKVKVSYGYDSIPYTFEIIASKRRYIHKNGEAMFSSAKFFGPVEGLALIGLLIHVIERLFKVLFNVAVR